MVITSFRFPSDANQANDPINDQIKSITLIERAIVNIIKEHPSYSRSEIAQQLKVSEATIKRAIHLQALDVPQRFIFDIIKRHFAICIKTQFRRKIKLINFLASEISAINIED